MLLSLFIVFYLLIVTGRLYALQKGMEIDRKSPDCRNFLAALMNMLEEVAFSSDVLWLFFSFTFPTLHYIIKVHWCICSWLRASGGTLGPWPNLE